MIKVMEMRHFQIKEKGEKQMAICPKCSGGGDIVTDCGMCEGTGEVYAYDEQGNLKLVTCSSCGGTGTRYTTCTRCNGSGEV
jgi:DnaJ-class molecular chaperone